MDNPFLTRNLKVFLISFSLVFVMAALPKLGLTQKFISPLPKKDDAFDKVGPLLDQKPNQFNVINNSGLVTKAQASGDYDQAAAYALVDFDTGEVLLGKNLNQELPIASLTKIMTAVVSLDLDNKDDLLTVSQIATQEPATRFAFSPGDKLTLEETLNGMLLTSANDMAEVIKESMDQKYGGDVFIRAMNQKAQDLGLKDTHFENPQGFDGDYQYSSAGDLVTLTHYALTQYPLITSIVAKDHSEITPTKYHSRDEYLNNWNGLLGVYPGVSGMKIGNTEKAGYTTAVVSERNGHKLIAVLLGAPGVLERDLWTAELLDAGFSKYGLAPINVSQQALREKYSTWKYPES